MNYRKKYCWFHLLFFVRIEQIFC